METYVVWLSLEPDEDGEEGYSSSTLYALKNNEEHIKIREMEAAEGVSHVFLGEFMAMDWPSAKLRREKLVDGYNSRQAALRGD